MRKLLILVLLVAAVAAILLVGLVLSQPKPKVPEADVQAPAPEAPTAAAAAVQHATFYPRHTPVQPAQTPVEAPSVATAPAPATLITNWADKLDEILGASIADSDKASQMLQMFPNLPPDGQEEAARHLSNLLPDQDYGQMRSYLTNADLPENVLDVLLDDALNRPNSLKLPALLDIARNEQNPEAAQAKDFLELFLDEDYGTNWDQWQASMDQWLKENPD